MPASLRDFLKISKLGEGSYSSVYKVQRIEDGEFYALKKVLLGQLSEQEKQNALNEVRIIASMRHPNIVNFHECFIDTPSNSLCIVMEYADDGDLLSHISRHKKGGTHFHEEEIWSLLTQVIQGLHCLHSLKVMHRDLKSANIFMNKDGSVKLGDFNVSKICKQGLLYTQTGTPYYASPEVWNDKPYDVKADIWSVGCIVYEMCALKPPFRAQDMASLFQKVSKGLYSRVSTLYSTELCKIIDSMLLVQPNLRPNSDQLLKNEMIRERVSRQSMKVGAKNSVLMSTLNFAPQSNSGQGSSASEDPFKGIVMPSANYSPKKQQQQQSPPSHQNPKVSSSAASSPLKKDKPRSIVTGVIAATPEKKPLHLGSPASALSNKQPTQPTSPSTKPRRNSFRELSILKSPARVKQQKLQVLQQQQQLQSPQASKNIASTSNNTRSAKSEAKNAPYNNIIVSPQAALQPSPNAIIIQPIMSSSSEQNSIQHSPDSKMVSSKQQQQHPRSSRQSAQQQQQQQPRLYSKEQIDFIYSEFQSQNQLHSICMTPNPPSCSNQLIDSSQQTAWTSSINNQSTVPETVATASQVTADHDAFLLTPIKLLKIMDTAESGIVTRSASVNKKLAMSSPSQQDAIVKKRKHSILYELLDKSGCKTPNAVTASTSTSTSAAAVVAVAAITDQILAKSVSRKYPVTQSSRQLAAEVIPRSISQQQSNQQNNFHSGSPTSVAAQVAAAAAAAGGLLNPLSNKLSNQCKEQQSQQQRAFSEAKRNANLDHIKLSSHISLLQQQQQQNQLLSSGKQNNQEDMNSKLRLPSQHYLSISRVQSTEDANEFLNDSTINFIPRVLPQDIIINHQNSSMNSATTATPTTTAQNNSNASHNVSTNPSTTVVTSTPVNVSTVSMNSHHQSKLLRDYNNSILQPYLTPSRQKRQLSQMQSQSQSQESPSISPLKKHSELRTPQQYRYISEDSVGGVNGDSEKMKKMYCGINMFNEKQQVQSLSQYQQQVGANVMMTSATQSSSINLPYINNSLKSVPTSSSVMKTPRLMRLKGSPIQKESNRFEKLAYSDAKRKHIVYGDFDSFRDEETSMSICSNNNNNQSAVTGVRSHIRQSTSLQPHLAVDSKMRVY